jgi:carbon monoxide dehydrogenase subunit G
MAMRKTGEKTLRAARSKVWALLNDPHVLKACIPGCQSLEKVGDNGFATVAKVKIGPVVATFKGKIELSHVVPDVSCTIVAEGEGGTAGFAKGSGKVTLADAASGTILRYDIEADVGGKIAQLGSRSIEGAAKEMADRFFSTFAETAADTAPVEVAVTHPANVEARVKRDLGKAPALARRLAAGLEATPAGSATTAPRSPVAPSMSASGAAPKVYPPQEKSWLSKFLEWLLSRWEWLLSR